MKNTQVIIIGGGLAGLTAAIALRKKDIEVALIEKNEYPHHKVCGEYLSNEVIPYLEYLEVGLQKLSAPVIDQMEFSSASGQLISCDLGLGGLGISRYTLDNHLYELAVRKGCKMITDSVEDVGFKNDQFEVKLSNGNYLRSEFVLGAFGKRSNLDKNLGRSFINNQSEWLAIKSHYTNSKFPNNLVSLHNFEGGYCGLSRTELNTINVCYLASYKSFKRYKSTEEFKNNVLRKNPHLDSFFKESKMIFEKELSIAQVSFEKKNLVEDHILMLGDSAGLIHPLCGNGMAMAIHSAKIATDNIDHFYRSKEYSRNNVETDYKSIWKSNFDQRLRSGRILQKILLNQRLSNLSQKLIKTIPGLMPMIVRQTHGNPLNA